MKILTYEQYKEFYDKRGYCVDSVGVPKNGFTERQLKYKYEKYVIKEERKLNNVNKKKYQKREIKKDVEWERVRAEAFALNPNAEEFWESLNAEEYKIMKRMCKGEFGKLDPCHIFGKGSYPNGKYIVENIIIAPRYFHTKMDNYINPFTNKFMSAKERDEIWKKIIGEKVFEDLRDAIK